MKKILLIGILILSVTNFSMAQKYAYVDTQYILDNIPAYAEAQTKLDDYAVKWQQEIETKYNLIAKKRLALQAEEILLPEEIKAEKQANILKLETEAKELQKKYFGVNGMLFEKRGELIKPIQDNIFEAIK